MKKIEADLKYFSALSDLLLESIRTQKATYSITLSNFFNSEFKKVRDKFTNEPVVYPELYYKTVYRAIEELAIFKEKRNYLLEHRTSAGVWLLGESQGKEISEITYLWLWKNILLAVRYQQDDLIMNHWEFCHQYYSYNMPSIYKRYDNPTNNFQVSNQVEVDKRRTERQKFIEFHYALGGLLTYLERYSCLKRIFNYTQSQPPKYELLPESMEEIFKFYFDVKDPYDSKYSWISHLYQFPELSGLNADHAIKKWIMSYMTILFLRQWTIHPYLITMRPLDFPRIPQTQSEIKQWIDGLDFFKKLVFEHLKNRELLKTLSLDFITLEWCAKNEKPYPIDFIEKFKSTLEGAYHSNAMNLALSPEKILQFENKTKAIVEYTIEKFQTINNVAEIQDDNSDKWYVSGQKMLQSKDALSENPEVHHMEFDSYLASVVSTNLNEELSELFIRKISKSYLLKSNDFFKAIDKLGIDETFVIVNFGLHLDYFINELKVPGLSNHNYKKTNIYTFNGSHIVRDTLFILKKTDLPNISTKPITDDIIAKYSLKKISDSINLYSSAIDLNKATEEVFNENKQDRTDDEVRKSVLLNITILAEFKWKMNIEVIRLIQYSEFFQNGLANKIDDVTPLDKR